MMTDSKNKQQQSRRRRQHHRQEQYQEQYQEKQQVYKNLEKQFQTQQQSQEQQQQQELVQKQNQQQLVPKQQNHQREQYQNHPTINNYGSRWKRQSGTRNNKRGFLTLLVRMILSIYLCMPTVTCFALTLLSLQSISSSKGLYQNPYHQSTSKARYETRIHLIPSINNNFINCRLYPFSSCRKITRYHTSTGGSKRIKESSLYKRTSTVTSSTGSEDGSEGLRSYNEERWDSNRTTLQDPTESVWEVLASIIVNVPDANQRTLSTTKQFVECVTILRAGIPALFLGTLAKWIYPGTSLWLASIINDASVFEVVSQDLSQYIQNILTTSGLVFALLVGQTYYFMYQQQESTFLALYEEVTMAKSLLEQIALVCQGREGLYQKIMVCVDRYVQTDLIRFNDVEPASLISSRPVDDPLEDILFLTSVGEPSIVYGTVKSLRVARARRLGALQKKLPEIHTTLLWVLFTNVLLTFPLLGAGCQTIGGTQILQIQSFYFGFIVFGMALVLAIISELQRPSEVGAYNARSVLCIMVKGLEEELKDRLNGTITLQSTSSLQRQQQRKQEGSATKGPSIDSDGYFDEDILHIGSGRL